MNIVGGKSRTVRLNQKPANLVVFVFNLGPDDRNIGDGAGSDPHFLAVENIFVADFTGAGQHPSGIRSESGLGKPEAAKLFALLHGRQPSFLLLLAAKFIDRIHAKRRLHADEAAHAGVAAFEFLRHQSVFDIAHASAAVAFERRAEESEIGHGLDQFARKAPGAVALLDDGNKVVLNELASGVANQAFFFGEQRIELDEIHTAKFDGRHDEISTSECLARTTAWPEVCHRQNRHTQKGKHLTVAGAGEPGQREIR